MPAAEPPFPDRSPELASERLALCRPDRKATPSVSPATLHSEGRPPAPGPAADPARSALSETRRTPFSRGPEPRSTSPRRRFQVCGLNIPAARSSVSCNWVRLKRSNADPKSCCATSNCGCVWLTAMLAPRLLMTMSDRFCTAGQLRLEWFALYRHPSGPGFDPWNEPGSPPAAMRVPVASVWRLKSVETSRGCPAPSSNGAVGVIRIPANRPKVTTQRF